LAQPDYLTGGQTEPGFIARYYPLYIAYATALVGWLIVWRIKPNLWPRAATPGFAHPWREVGWALLAGVGIILIGQLYQRGLRLSGRGPLREIAEVANQAMIFSPIWILLFIRGQGLSTVWLPTNRIGTRIIIGLILAVVALFAYCVARSRPSAWFDTIKHVYHWKHLGFAAQVFFEDVAIAMLMVRLAAALRRPWLAAVIVGFLFAAGHIPAMLENGVRFTEMTGLLFDFVLAASAIAVLQRAADVWWFWCVHFAMDMTQFQS